MNGKAKPWTPEESKFVLQNFGPMTAKQLSEKLPGRTVKAVRELVRRYDMARGAR